MQSITAVRKVFVSYSWDSEEHKQWVRQLATDLVEKYGIDVDLDQWMNRPGNLKPLYMELIKQADRVIMVCSQKYVQKADQPQGGVGYEGVIIRKVLTKDLTTNRFIPIIRNNDSDDLPLFMGDRIYIDFRDDQLYHDKIEELAREIHDAPINAKPKLGTNPFEQPVEGTKDDIFGMLVGQAGDLKNRIQKLGIQYLAEPDEEKRRYLIPIFNFLSLRDEPEEIGAKPYFEWAHDFHNYLIRMKDFAQFSGISVDSGLDDYWKVINLHLGKADYWEDFEDFNIPPDPEKAEKELREIDYLLRTIPENLQKHIDRLNVLKENLNSFQSPLKVPTLESPKKEFASSTNDICESLDGSVGLRMHGAGSWTKMGDEIDLNLTNNWFEPIQVFSIVGRWWPLDKKHYESKLQFTKNSNRTPQVLNPKERLKFIFELTAQDIKRSQLPIDQYPLEAAKRNERAFYLIYEFFVRFKTQTEPNCERVFSYSYQDEEQKSDQRKNSIGTAYERARANEFRELYNEANQLRETDPNQAIDYYFKALPHVSGFWDDNLEESKLTARVWLWTLLTHEAFHWGNGQIKDSALIEKAESIFRNDDEFFDACRQLRMDFNSEIDLAAMIYCWAKANENPHEPRKWLEKTKDHAINAKSHFQTTNLSPQKRTMREAFFTAVAMELLKHINKELKNEI